MSGRTAMLHVPLDDETWEKAALALETVGLSVPEAVGLFLRRVIADTSYPLSLKVPNLETRAAMAEADDMARGRAARFSSADALFDALEKDGR